MLERHFGFCLSARPRSLPPTHGARGAAHLGPAKTAPSFVRQNLTVDGPPKRPHPCASPKSLATESFRSWRRAPFGRRSAPNPKFDPDRTLCGRLTLPSCLASSSTRRAWRGRPSAPVSWFGVLSNGDAKRCAPDRSAPASTLALASRHRRSDQVLTTPDNTSPSRSPSDT